MARRILRANSLFCHVWCPRTIFDVSILRLSSNESNLPGGFPQQARHNTICITTPHRQDVRFFLGFHPAWVGLRSALRHSGRAGACPTPPYSNIGIAARARDAASNEPNLPGGFPLPSAASAAACREGARG